MKIIVCVKQVSIVTTRNGIDPSANRLLPSEMVYRLNPHDEAAVEEALVLRERHGGTVTVLTYGPSRAAEALRWCLAMGADAAVHVVDEAPPEMSPFAVAGVLANAVEGSGCDLLLFGRAAIDDGMGQTGTLVAEMLDLPVATAVVRIELHSGEGRAVLLRALERGNREIVECVLPAALTVDMQANRPRYPTLGGRRAARRATIRTIPAEKGDGALPRPDGIPAVEIVRVAQPKIRPKKILSPDESESAAGRMQWILSGGNARKGGGRLTGDAGRLADGILDYLAERSFISRRR